MHSFFSETATEIRAGARRKFSLRRENWGARALHVCVLQGTLDSTADVVAVRDLVAARDARMPWHAPIGWSGLLVSAS